MKSAKELLDSIKALFNETAKFAEYTLEDGTVISVSALEVGGEVKVGDAAAPAGTHKLPDGSSIVTDEAGIITEIIAAEAKFEDHTLEDGTVLSVSSLEVGGEVKIGETTAPAGTYKISEAKSIVVDEAGLITEVIEIEAPLDSPEEMVKKFATGTPEERITNLETICKALMERCLGYEMKEAAVKTYVDEAIKAYPSLFEEVKKKLEKHETILPQIFDLVEEMTKEPAGDPPANTKKDLGFSKVENKKDKLSKYADAAQKLKENA